MPPPPADARLRIDHLPYVERLEARPVEAVDMVVVHCTELPDLATARSYGERVLYSASGTGNSGHWYIDRDGSTALVDSALMFKQDFSARTDADMAIVTQFAFDPQAVTAWAERIADMGVTLPIHAGIAGPAKLQTLIQFALSCGVGPSVSVLQKRARDVTRLLMPYEPTEVVAGFADYMARHPHSLISQLHVFPLGGIRTAAEWMKNHAAAGAALAAN